MSGGWIEVLPHPTNQVLAGERRHPQKRVTEEGVLAIGGQGEEGTEDGQKGSRCPPQAAGPGEGAATPRGCRELGRGRDTQPLQTCSQWVENKF